MCDKRLSLLRVRTAGTRGVVTPRASAYRCIKHTIGQPFHRDRNAAVNMVEEAHEFTLSSYRIAHVNRSNSSTATPSAPRTLAHSPGTRDTTHPLDNLPKNA